MINFTFPYQHMMVLSSKEPRAWFPMSEVRVWAFDRRKSNNQSTTILEK